MPKCVIILPIPKTGPNGDRDTQRHPYFDYEIHVADLSEELSLDTAVHEVSGYDHFNSHIHNREGTKNEAIGYARRLAERIGAQVKIMGEDLKIFEVTTRSLIMASSPEEAILFYRSKTPDPHARELK